MQQAQLLTLMARLETFIGSEVPTNRADAAFNLNLPEAKTLSDLLAREWLRLRRADKNRPQETPFKNNEGGRV